MTTTVNPFFHYNHEIELLTKWSTILSLEWESVLQERRSLYQNWSWGIAWKYDDLDYMEYAVPCSNYETSIRNIISPLYILYDLHEKVTFDILWKSVYVAKELLLMVHISIWMWMQYLA